MRSRRWEAHGGAGSNGPYAVPERLAVLDGWDRRAAASRHPTVTARARGARPPRQGMRTQEVADRLSLSPGHRSHLRGAVDGEARRRDTYPCGCGGVRHRRALGRRPHPASRGACPAGRGARHRAGRRAHRAAAPRRCSDPVPNRRAPCSATGGHRRGGRSGKHRLTTIPKAGAFTAATLIVPRSLFTTSVANASPSTSSAIIKIGLPNLATCSRMGSMSLIDAIFFSLRRMTGLFKYGLHRFCVGDEVR